MPVEWEAGEKFQPLENPRVGTREMLFFQGLELYSSPGCHSIPPRDEVAASGLARTRELFARGKASPCYTLRGDQNPGPRRRVATPGYTVVLTVRTEQAGRTAAAELAGAQASLVGPYSGLGDWRTKRERAHQFCR